MKDDKKNNNALKANFTIWTPMLIGTAIIASVIALALDSCIQKKPPTSVSHIPAIENPSKTR